MKTWFSGKTKRSVL